VRTPQLLNPRCLSVLTRCFILCVEWRRLLRVEPQRQHQYPDAYKSHDNIGMAGTGSPSRKRAQTIITSVKVSQRKKHKSDDDAIMEEFINLGVTIRDDPIEDDEDMNDNEAKPRFSDTQLRERLAAFSEAEIRKMLVNLAYEVPVVKRALLRKLAAPQLVDAEAERVVRVMYTYNYSLVIESILSGAG
jgi:hypothetical protein